MNGEIYNEKGEMKVSRRWKSSFRCFYHFEFMKV